MGKSSMQQFVSHFVDRYGVDLTTPDTVIDLQSASGRQRLVIQTTDVDEVTVSYSHWNTPGAGMIDVDVVYDTSFPIWEIMEIRHSPSAWDEFIQGAAGESITVYDEVGIIIKESFAQYWVTRLITYGWLGQEIQADISSPCDDAANREEDEDWLEEPTAGAQASKQFQAVAPTRTQSAGHMEQASLF